MQQVNLNLKEEADDFWGDILGEPVDFESRNRLIEAIKNVTTKQVNDKFKELFLNHPKRFNLKLNS